MILNGDCLEVLKTLDSDSIDSLVTDPPAGISFMGKSWDNDLGGRLQWIGWMTLVMNECLRVLKPGAHGLVWAIPRTSHWTATALEEAGFEVRDVVTHLFGSGFPKSHDISKGIDKQAGVEREVIGSNPNHRNAENVCTMLGNPHTGTGSITSPSTDLAKQWQGWGTALKPASEHWILVRKPCSEKTVASNVIKHGCGGINIDASRISASIEEQNELNRPNKRPGNGASGFMTSTEREFTPAQGRFPANLVLSHSEYCEVDQCDIECAILKLDEQSGPCKTGKLEPHHKLKASSNTSMCGANQERNPRQSFGGDTGGASRFFYCAKISTSERNAGLEDMPTKKVATSNGAKAALARGEEYLPDSSGFEKIKETKNTHPTVKPKKLMSYFIRMITPPRGTVLDPFMGSGSTGIAAKECGFNFIGIEKDQTYFEIAKKRIESTSIDAGPL